MAAKNKILPNMAKIMFADLGQIDAPSQIADPPIEDRIVPAVAAGILIARITAAGSASSAGGAWSSAVRLAIVEKSVAIFTSRNRGDDGARPRGDWPAAAMASTHCT